LFSGEGLLYGLTTIFFIPVFISHEGRGLFFICPAKITVELYKKCPKEAVPLLLSTYWVDIEYPNGFKKSLPYVTWLLGQTVNLQISVQRLIN